MPTHQNVDADGSASPLALMHALAPLGVEAIAYGQRWAAAQEPRRSCRGSSRSLVYGRIELPDTTCSAWSIARTASGSARSIATIPSGVERRDADRQHRSPRHQRSASAIVNVVVPTAASTAEIVAELIITGRADHDRHRPVPARRHLRRHARSAHRSHHPRTMRTAADLVDAGANPAAITDALFRIKPRSTVCLWEQALRDVDWTGKLIWTEVTQRNLETCGAEAVEAEGIVNFLTGTEGSRAAAILYEAEDGWRVSMRSIPADVDVAAIAAEFGGGGHPRAAGCQLRRRSREQALSRPGRRTDRHPGADSVMAEAMPGRFHGFLVIDKPAGWTSHDVVAPGPAPAEREARSDTRERSIPPRLACCRSRSARPPSRSSGWQHAEKELSRRDHLRGQRPIAADADGVVLASGIAGKRSIRAAIEQALRGFGARSSSVRRCIPRSRSAARSCTNYARRGRNDRDAAPTGRRFISIDLIEWDSPRGDGLRRVFEGDIHPRRLPRDLGDAARRARASVESG